MLVLVSGQGEPAAFDVEAEPWERIGQTRANRGAPAFNFKLLRTSLGRVPTILTGNLPVCR